MFTDVATPPVIISGTSRVGPVAGAAARLHEASSTDATRAAIIRRAPQQAGCIGCNINRNTGSTAQRLLYMAWASNVPEVERPPVGFHPWRMASFTLLASSSSAFFWVKPNETVMIW